MTLLTQPASRSWLFWLAWLPLVIALASTLVFLTFQETVCAPYFQNQSAERWNWIYTNISAIGFGVIGALIIIHQPRNRIGWLCSAIAVLTSVLAAPNVFLPCAENGLMSLRGISFLAWLLLLGAPMISLEFFLLPLIFPDGRFLSAGWRRFAVVVYSLLLLSTLLTMIWPGGLEVYEGMKYVLGENPLGLPFRPSPALTRLVGLIPLFTFVLPILIANFSLITRWRRSDSRTRQQLKVFTFYLISIGSIFMLYQTLILLLEPYFDLAGLWSGWLSRIYTVLLILLWAGYPLVVGLSVFKYRIYEIDIVIRKTLVYAALTASLALCFFGGVTLLQGLFQTISGQQSAIAIVISTLVIAALFNPLRRRIQSGIDRRFYRNKYDAQKMLEDFAQTARSQTDADQLTTELISVVQDTFQPESVTLWLAPTKERP